MLLSTGKLPFCFSSKIHRTQIKIFSHFSSYVVKYAFLQMSFSRDLAIASCKMLLRNTSMHTQMHAYPSSAQACTPHIATSIPFMYPYMRSPRELCAFLPHVHFSTQKGGCMRAHAHTHTHTKTVDRETRITIPMQGEGQTPFDLAVGSLFPYCTTPVLSSAWEGADGGGRRRACQSLTATSPQP